MRGYEFTPRIRQIRELLSLNQADFAKKLGISLKTLNNYESGNSIPSSFTDKLNEIFSVNYEWFMYGKGEPFNPSDSKQMNLTQSGYSQRIKTIRETLGLKISDFVRQLDIPRSTLVGWEEGKTVSIDILKTLEKVFNVDIHWFLTGEGTMFLSSTLPLASTTNNEIAKSGESSFRVPLLRQKVSCGPGISWQDEDNIVDHIDIFDNIPRLKFKRPFALLIEGNSMVGAGIKNGDYVLFDSTVGQNPRDDIYVFALDGEVYCKLLEFDMNKIKIYSVRVADLEKAELMKTLDIEDISTADRLTIFGRVLYWIHPNLNFI